MSRELNRILYLEDDPFIAEIALFALRDMGNFEVRHCATGTQALNNASSFGPDLCLFDVMVPEMDGVETFTCIRDLEGYANLPVIFMTAKAQRHEVDRYKQLGALDVIVKPFEPVTLADEVRSIWGRVPA